MKMKNCEGIGILWFVFLAISIIFGVIGIFCYPLVFVAIFSFIVGLVFEIWALVLSINS